MRYLSVCSGVEAATVAWHPIGWTPAAFSEIEKFPSAVLAHHYPNVPNLGDMTKFKDWPDDLDPDLLVGGTPCQSFSVAGLRKGLDDPRGNLMLTYLAIADRYRPKWLVWENVPGVLSSNGGRDFGTFLGALGQLGYGWAYRVLDAQYFGVPQRRRRVFVVGCLGGWQRAAAVLFERHSLQGHPAPSRGAGQGTARGFETGPSGGRLTDLAPTIDCRAKNGPIQNQLGVGVMEVIPEVTRPLTAAMGTKWNGNGDLESSLIPSIVGTLTANMVGCAGTPGYNETEHILPLLVRMREGKEGGGKGPLVSEDQSLTLATGNDQVLVCPTLTASNDPSRSPQSSEVTQQVAAVHAASMQVRRFFFNDSAPIEIYPLALPDALPLLETRSPEIRATPCTGTSLRCWFA
ncbi:MAG: DNA (cytosine-5-)-methyltransferase [Lewinella sp.]|nr:DNA (cytosine-5-)-methyltransferase [Lewinella sp.]